MALRRLLGLGSKRLRALTILAAAVRAIRAGRRLRGITLIVASVLAWKYFIAALVVETALDLLRSDDGRAEGEI